jgi:dTDP-4-amino-4,6-dideoxygalactose transaminase
MHLKYDLFFPYYNGKKIQKAVKKIFPKDWKNQWIGQGELVDEFEQQFAKKFNLSHCLMTNSGTSALWLAYDLVGLKEGDEVISTVLTCTATHIPLLYRKVKIKFADIQSDTLTIDPIDVEKKITKKTKAIIGVTLGGIPLDDRIFKIGKKYKIPVIVDSCQSIGYDKGDYIVYSFQAIKQITTGDGGMLVCRNKKDYKRAKLLRWFGIDREQKARKNWQAWQGRTMTFDIQELGYKFQPHNISAMLGLVGLGDFDKVIQERKYLTEIYKWQLRDIPEITLLNDRETTCWLFGILINDRDKLAKYLEDRGIGTNVVHVRNDAFEIFKKFKTHCPNMDEVYLKYLYLPLHNKLKAKDIMEICRAIKEYYDIYAS